MVFSITSPSFEIFNFCFTYRILLSRVGNSSSQTTNYLFILFCRSKSMYNRSAGPVIALAACEGGHSLVAATQEGSIFVLRYIFFYCDITVSFQYLKYDFNCSFKIVHFNIFFTLYIDTSVFYFSKCDFVCKT